MQIENSFEVGAPPDTVYAFLLDVNRVVACVPGPAGAHRIDNRTDAPATVLIVSTMVGPELVEYPDTGRVWGRSCAPGAQPSPDDVHIAGDPSDSVDPFAGER